MHKQLLLIGGLLIPMHNKCAGLSEALTQMGDCSRSTTSWLLKNSTSLVVVSALTKSLFNQMQYIVTQVRHDTQLCDEAYPCEQENCPRCRPNNSPERHAKSAIRAYLLAGGVGFVAQKLSQTPQQLITQSFSAYYGATVSLATTYGLTNVVQFFLAKANNNRHLYRCAGAAATALTANYFNDVVTGKSTLPKLSGVHTLLIFHLDLVALLKGLQKAGTWLMTDEHVK